jgi:hypothetical protein
VTTKQSGSQVVLGNAFFTDGMRKPCHVDQNPQNGDLLIPDLHAIITIDGAEGKPMVQLGENYGTSEKQGWPNFREIRGRPAISSRRVPRVGFGRQHFRRRMDCRRACYQA